MLRNLGIFKTRENLVEKLEFSIGGKIKILRKWNVY